MKRVLVGISGGVDSSVSAYLLKQQGYEVIGAHMHFWSDTKGKQETQNKCCSVGAIASARKVCKSLDIPFYVLEVQATFKERVVDYFIASSASETPNPCVMCNRYIKFGAFLDKAKELDCDFIAMGHYARIVDGALHRGLDASKDQSYFLYRLTEEQLSRILLPVGGLLKEDVKAIAREHGLIPSFRKESQDLCFYGEKYPKAFIKREVDPSAVKEGSFIHIETGQPLGRHEGFALYTIGQRKGLCIGGMKDPLYVVHKDKAQNVIYLGPKAYLASSGCEIRETIFRGPIPERFSVQVRYRSRPIGARASDNQILFDEPITSVTPGQSLVFYDEDQCIGGGIISKAIPQLSYLLPRD